MNQPTLFDQGRDSIATNHQRRIVAAIGDYQRQQNNGGPKRTTACRKSPSITLFDEPRRKETATR